MLLGVVYSERNSVDVLKNIKMPLREHVKNPDFLLDGSLEGGV